MTAPPSAIITPARSIELSELDRTEWWDWWEYNKERFLGLDDVLARLHPITPRGDDLVGPDLGRRAGLDARRVYGELVPALVSELEAEDNILFRRRALLALGRIGEAPEGFESTVDSLSSVIASFLSSEQSPLDVTAPEANAYEFQSPLPSTRGSLYQTVGLCLFGSVDVGGCPPPASVPAWVLCRPSLISSISVTCLLICRRTCLGLGSDSCRGLCFRFGRERICSTARVN